MLVVEIGGLQPAAHHVANLAFHAANVVLLLLVLHRATGSLGCSAVVAGLFGLHPMHVESVAWISERKDVLSTSFWLASTAAYLAYLRSGSLAAYLAALVSMALGLLCKPMLVTLPLVFLLLDLWPLDRLRRGAGASGTESVPFSRLALEKIPFLVLAVAGGVLAIVAQRAAGALVPVESSPFPNRLGNAALAVVAYLRKTIWPVDLAVFYPFPERLNLSAVVGATAAIVVTTTAVALLYRRIPYVTVGWAWFLVTLAPVVGIVRIGAQAFADRYTYVPHVGLFVAVVFAAREGLRRIRGGATLGVVLSAAALIGCFARTRAQVATWRDDFSLFGRAIEVTEGNYLAHQKLGGAYSRAGRIDEAVEHYEESIRIRPTYALAQNNLGILWLERGRKAEAEARFRAAMAADSSFADAPANLGQLLCARGDESEGVSFLERALRVDPNHAWAHLNLAEFDGKEGRYAEALEHYRAALVREPGLAQAMCGIAWIRATVPGNLDGAEAVRMAEKAAAIQPRNAAMLHTLAAAYARAGRFDEAVRVAGKAVDVATRTGDEKSAGRYASSLTVFRAGRALELQKP
jgi:tetratricopeptide (TPR) repeat protein